MRSITLALGLLASVSLAQQPEPTPNSQRVPVQKVDFTGTTIDSVRSAPTIDMYVLPPKSRFKNLIKVRMRFDDKLAESVHEM